MGRNKVPVAICYYTVRIYATAQMYSFQLYSVVNKFDVMQKIENGYLNAVSVENSSDMLNREPILLY